MYHRPPGISRSPTPACQAQNQRQKLSGVDYFPCLEISDIGRQCGGDPGRGTPEGAPDREAPGWRLLLLNIPRLSALPAAFCGGARTFVRRRTRPPDWGSGGKEDERCWNVVGGGCGLRGILSNGTFWMCHISPFGGSLCGLEVGAVVRRGRLDAPGLFHVDAPGDTIHVRLSPCRAGKASRRQMTLLAWRRHRTPVFPIP